MTSRRELLRLMGIAPVAAKSAVGELTSLLAAPSTKALVASASAMAIQNQAGCPEPSYGPFGKFLGQRLEYLREVADLQEQALLSARLHQFDHDISAIKSTSRTYKAVKQTARDNADVESNIRARRTMWGDITGFTS